jgi:drug/metabolite transporter (DMT)-like permease
VENTASILILISGFAHAVVNAIFFATAAGQWKPGLIAGALSIITYGFALFAFRLGATPRLAALRETSILFGTAIAVIFLKERLTTLRFGGVLAIALGAIVLIAIR